MSFLTIFVPVLVIESSLPPPIYFDLKGKWGFLPCNVPIGTQAIHNKLRTAIKFLKIYQINIGVHNRTGSRINGLLVMMYYFMTFPVCAFPLYRLLIELKDKAMVLLWKCGLYIHYIKKCPLLGTNLLSKTSFLHQIYLCEFKICWDEIILPKN